METQPVNNFNLGGISESKYAGLKYSLSKMVGVDVHSKPGAIQASHKLTKESGSTVDAAVQVMVPSSDGNVYLFSKTSGKVWKRAGSDGTYSLMHTTTPAAGSAGCLGAAEYNGYIYWATQSRLHRITIANLGNWTLATEDFATFTNTDAEYHPMVIANSVLYIGDGNLVAQVDGTTFTANALDVQTPKRISSLTKAINELVVGTYVADNVNKSSIYDWNTWSTSFTSEDEIEEVGIHAFLKADNFIIAYAGMSGNLYSYNLQELTKLKRIPGSYTSTATAIVNPNAVANLQGLPLFGLSQEVGNPTEFGVYSFGSANPVFPSILVLEYPIYPSSTLVTADLKIHSMTTIGNTVLVAWEYDSAFGVSSLDYTAWSNGAYFDTMVIRGDRNRQKTVSEIAANYSELPTGTSITMQYKDNYNSSWQNLTLIKDTINMKYYADVSIRANTFEVRTIFNTSASGTPVIDELNITLS